MAKSLKEQNRWQLWIIIAANTLLLYAVVQTDAFGLDSFRSVLSDPEKLVPMGLAVVIATVLNGVLSADAKERLVFLRWKNALPGHRAFSRYAKSDPRIDLVALRKTLGAEFPVNPVEQNRVWYRIFKTVEEEPAVSQVHRDFLLLRDYTGLSVLFIIFYGAVGLYTIASAKTLVLYLLALIIQYFVVRQAASQYGVRMVKTVLAQKAAKVT